MRPTRLQWGSFRTDIVELRGGINENVSSLELKAGELIDVKNYMIAEGGYGGYLSFPGFERYDGTTLPSQYRSYVLDINNAPNVILEGDIVVGDTSGATATALGNGTLIDGSYAGGDATATLQASIGTGTFTAGETLSVGATPVGTLSVVTELTGGNDTYNLGIQYGRSLISAVPGEGKVLGCHVYLSKVYAFRKKVGLNEVGFYVEDGSTGWIEIDTTADPILYDSGHTYRMRFSNYNFKASIGSFSMFWCDGLNQARSYNVDDGVNTIDNVGMSATGIDKPINIKAHNNYLFLAYEGGSLQHSVLGDPTDWTGASGAGEIALGQEITNLIIGVASTLIVFLEEGIRILKGVVSTDFSLETFSETSGAYKGTAQRLLGTAFFVDDRGLSTLGAVQEFGDYAANTISQRFKTTLRRNSQNIVATTTNRDFNQYRIFFSDRTGICVSFEGKEFQGATFFEYPRALSTVGVGEDEEGNDKIVFSTDDEEGYIYKMDSGYSFDQTTITCRLTTAFYHYGSPRNWKTLKRATVEVAGENDQTFLIKASFDYNEPGVKQGEFNEMLVYTIEGSAVYGDSLWGIMKYGTVEQATNRVPVYLKGIGTNISYKVISNEAYRPQHIIQNIITDYELNARRL